MYDLVRGDFSMRFCCSIRARNGKDFVLRMAKDFVFYSEKIVRLLEHGTRELLSDYKKRK